MARFLRFGAAVAIFFSVTQGNAFAQAPITCADLQWSTWPEPGVQVNTAGANKSTPTNSKLLQANAAKKAAYLSCDAKPLLLLAQPTFEMGAGAKADKFQTTVNQALRGAASSSSVAAQAIYLEEVFPGPQGAQGYSYPTTVWLREQGQQWCQQNVKNQNSEDVKIPNKLPTLGEGVRQLNARAIALSWQVLSSSEVDGLKEGCSKAVQRFVEKARL